MSRVVYGRIKIPFFLYKFKKTKVGVFGAGAHRNSALDAGFASWFGVTSNWNDTLHLWNFILESNKGCDIFKKFGSSNKWIELSMVESKWNFYSKSVESGFIA